jgi:dihydrodipicolinate synthase/N-acetylneuraminate lyase
MTELNWSGVLPAITTPFTEDDRVDHAFLGKHAAWLVDNGSKGIIALGSLGEGATLRFDEKCAVLERLVQAVGDQVPVISTVSALSTGEAVELAQKARDIGCKGLMVLPPYVHKGPWEEMEAHFDAVFEATDLSCMLYNNPIAYGVDVSPERIARFAEKHANMHASKESSGDARRVTAVKALLGDRLKACVGLDDMVVEGVNAGAVGWVAGLVNALPRESVAVFEAARDGNRERAAELYRWFLPLLRLDVVPEFVQLIKLVQAEVDMGSERVRLPRRPVTGEHRERTLALVRDHLARRPNLN